MIAAAQEPTRSKPAWVKIVAKYQHSERWVSIGQVANTFIPYFVLTVFAYLSLRISYLLTLPLAVLAGGFLMRIFIIQHDCGHQSFFKSKKANNTLGFVCGVLTMTPYALWRMTHAVHHATSGDLDNRGIGDVETKTVREYLAANRSQRLWYRIIRNPLVMFLIAPLYLFMVNQRTPLAWRVATTKQGQRSLIYTDLALAAIWIPLIALLGLDTVIKVEIPIFLVAATVGVWMFFIQHNFEDTYWRSHPEWSFEQAALQGSSYYKLPKVLQWFSGNIGLHHIHHLSPKIPNYLLQKAYDENEYLQNVHTLTLRSSFKSVFDRLALWDEDQQKLVSFGYVEKHYLK